MSANKDLVIRAEYQIYRDRFALHAWQDKPNGLRGVLVDCIMENRTSDTACPEPSLFLDRGGAQQLMDDLWRAGIRPSDRKELPGETQALREHVSDLRKITFKLLKVEAA
jgi:hypothetical protein